MKNIIDFFFLEQKKALPIFWCQKQVISQDDREVYRIHFLNWTPFDVLTGDLKKTWKNFIWKGIMSSFWNLTENWIMRIERN